MDRSILVHLIETATEIEDGKYFDNFIVPAISGGAGTSINMNLNEIIANSTLQKMGHQPGSYELVDPIEHANIFQSTNDVIPTSLKLAVLMLLHDLEKAVNQHRAAHEQLEKNHRDHLRIGYTQMQEAVPSSFGRLFSSYSDALSRDWWRISKCFERIKVVNLGGSAIGTGITVPRFFMMEVVRTLQRITALPVTRGENLGDATSNLDSIVEVHAILKAHAVNLEKMVNDLRLLGSDLTGKIIHLPDKQIGSSIMPGKVNPVIPEFVISAVHKVYQNDQLIASLSGQGCLELNAYLPAIGHAIIESLKLLIGCNQTIENNLLNGLKINIHVAGDQLRQSAAIATALVPFIGYHKSADLARHMKNNQCGIIQANRSLNYIDEKRLMDLIRADKLLQEGFTISDLGENSPVE